MIFITVCCPHCQSEQIVKRGKTRRGTQRYLCQNTACTTGSFLLDYHNRGCLPEVKQTIIDMSLNASGIRDTARVLRKPAKQKLMRCGRLSATKATHAGCGMPLITTRVPFWPMFLGVGRTKFFCGLKRCWN